MIWHKAYSSDDVNKMGKDTLVEHIGIVIDELGEDFISGTMPVNKSTHQPMGILHGGANCVLAETLGSFGANLTLDPEKNYAVGLNINTNHIKAVRNGLVKGQAKLVHKGKTTQVWNIKTFNASGDLTSDSQLTMMILNRKL